jgi:hypothetical protein
MLFCYGRRRVRLASIAIVVLTAACAPAATNVRAVRAYAREDPTLKVTLDRVEDLAQTLALVDTILAGTSYTPGDHWPRRLPLRDAEFRARRDAIKERHPYDTGEFEVPVLKVYREHVEAVLVEDGPPNERGMYPSILDAVAGLVPRTPAIRAHWSAFRAATEALAGEKERTAKIEETFAALDEDAKRARAGELSDARAKLAAAEATLARAKDDLARDAELLAADAELDDGGRQQTARDAFAVLSVAFRIELEALALAPIVAVQSIRATLGAPREIVTFPTLKILRQARDLPAYLVGIKERFTRQLVVLEGLTGTLARALSTSIDASPGLALRESVVDQIVGITLDSIRVDLRAGGEAFFFGSIGTSAQQSSSNDDGTRTESYDYRGRRFKLDYRIEPIVLASARLDLVLDWIRLPGVAALGAQYSTDRVFRSGGTIETTSLGRQIGLRGTASDVLDVGLGLLGIRSSVKIARWTAGEVRVVEATDVTSVVDRAPLQLALTQVDVGYDVLFALGDASAKAWLEELVVGGRYLEYTLPRILYELRNVSSDPNAKDFRFARESPVQRVTSRYWLGGFTARVGVGEAPRFSPFVDLALFGGAGPTRFYLPIDPSAADAAGNREQVDDVAWVVNGGLGAGIRWRLLPRGSRLRLDLRALYRADFVSTRIDRRAGDADEERRTDFGTIDVFHGPALALRGAL